MALALDRDKASRKSPSSRRKRAPVCVGCDGRGWITGADLGIVGMCSDDGIPDRIPCIVCDGVPALEVARPAAGRRRAGAA